MRIQPKQILVPVAALVGLSLYAQAKAAGQLSYRISTIELRFDSITPVIKLNVLVSNPSGQSFTIRSITGNLFTTLDAKSIGSVSMFDTIVIAPNSQVILPLFIRLNPLAIVSDILVLIQRGSGNSQELKFAGYVNANGLVTDLNLSYKIS